ncbi:hypothetical protein J3R83DRAFT_5362 [Lanmaoa asiatica]|nr:hypothetical protein J3R83DRAFT_5362 [Lanmaoa asiatica]
MSYFIQAFETCAYPRVAEDGLFMRAKLLPTSAVVSTDPVGRPADADNVRRALVDGRARFMLTSRGTYKAQGCPLSHYVSLRIGTGHALVRQRQYDGSVASTYLSLRCLSEGRVAWRGSSLEKVWERYTFVQRDSRSRGRLRDTTSTRSSLCRRGLLMGHDHAWGRRPVKVVDAFVVGTS